VKVYGQSTASICSRGEVVTVDTGHSSRYDLHIQFRMRRAVEGRPCRA